LKRVIASSPSPTWAALDGDEEGPNLQTDLKVGSTKTKPARSSAGNTVYCDESVQCTKARLKSISQQDLLELDVDVLRWQPR
jgi:hypothetical protein